MGERERGREREYRKKKDGGSTHARTHTHTHAHTNTRKETFGGELGPFDDIELLQIRLRLRRSERKKSRKSAPYYIFTM